MIVYRPIQPSDIDVLEQMHVELFPIRYEREFFLNVVNRCGIISWGAVDTSKSDGNCDQLIGFVTTRIVAAKDSEIEDLFRYNPSRRDLTLVYILTLGVVEHYRNLGIASALVQEVINYSTSMSHCRGAYLHVISYNQPAINFYNKMMFKLVRRLPMFYYIKGQHYDSYLFVYYVNGGRSPCSPLDIVTSIATHVASLMRSILTLVWRKEDKSMPQYAKIKDVSPLVEVQSMRIIGAEGTG